MSDAGVFDAIGAWDSGLASDVIGPAVVAHSICRRLKVNLRTDRALAVRSTPLLRFLSETPSTATGRLLSRLALFVILPTLIAIVSAAWLCNRYIRERLVSERSATLNVVADQASAAIGALIRADDIIGARKVVASVGRAPGVAVCTLMLPDGRIVADSAAKRVDFPSLPRTWQATIDLAESGPADSVSFILKTIELPGRGQLYLRSAFDSATSAVTLTKIMGFDMLGVVSMLFALIAHRRLRSQLTGMTALSDAVTALATQRETPLSELKNGESICREAGSWNVCPSWVFAPPYRPACKLR